MNSLWLASLIISSVVSADVFGDAARAQLESRHQDAIKAYEQLNTTGIRNGDVEFNLGTSYAESGDYGQGVLHLLRAKRLRPADDITLSLNVIREKVLEQKTTQTGRETDLTADLADNLAGAPLEFLLFLASLLIAAGITWRFLIQRGRMEWANALLGVGLVAGFVMGGLILVRRHYSDDRPAAVIVKRTTAREGPDDRFRALGSLLSGEEVRVARGNESASHSGIWLPGGKLAFVPKDAVELVEDWN